MIESKTEDFKEEDKIKDLGNKICRLVKYYEKKKSRIWEIAALADVLFAIVRILRDYKKRLKTIEAELRIYTKGEIKKIKVGGTDPD